MTERLDRLENSFDLEKDADPDDLQKLVEIADSFYFQGELNSFEDFYTFDEVKAIRFSLAFLYPNLELASDKKFYKNLKTESQTFIDRKELENYLTNAIHRKVIFPEKHEELSKEIDNLNMYENLVNLLRSTNQEGSLLETYTLARDIKLLYPERFTDSEILKILKQNTWEENITKYAKALRKKSPDYCDEITNLAAAINILEYPEKIQFDADEWKFLKKYKDSFVDENDYTGLAEYLMKLKIISADEIKITQEEIRLIF